MVCAKDPAVETCGILALILVTLVDGGLYAQTFASRIFPRASFAMWTVKELGELLAQPKYVLAPSSELALPGSNQSNNSSPQLKEGSS